MMISHKILGFTLLELAIVIVIVGSVAIFNSPGHKQYLMQTKRSDAKKALVALWHQQQTYHESCGHYAGQLGTKKTCVVGSEKLSDYQLVASAVSPKGYYNLSIVSASANSYIIQAVPKPEGMQSNDTKCAKLTLDQAGHKRAYTQSNQLTEECWKKS